MEEELNLKSAREKRLEEENIKVKEFVEYQGSVIFNMSEQERLTKTELARTKRKLMICEKRSSKIKDANARMLEYISKKMK